MAEKLGFALGSRCWRGGTCGGAIRISPISEYAYCAVCGWDETESSRSPSSEGVGRLVEAAGKILSCDREALADHRPKGGIADCIDNTGVAYQSQFMADALEALRSALAAVGEEQTEGRNGQP